MALSERQSKILEFIKSFTLDNGYPPTIREIGQAVNISSTSVVNYNLNALQKEGHIMRDRTVSRGIRLAQGLEELRGTVADVIQVPLLGRIAAGTPIPVPEDGFADEMIELTSDIVPTSNDIYALQVRGNSMIDAFINDGDMVIMRYQQTANEGDMVAAWLVNEEETTLKRYYHEGSRIRLQPENSEMLPIYVAPDNLQIQGKVLAVIRQVN
ncbi:MAG: transcriptional repressor LexA [Anaerolineae bacterium]|jgi:repressor LexA